MASGAKSGGRRSVLPCIKKSVLVMVRDSLHGLPVKGVHLTLSCGAEALANTASDKDGLATFGDGTIKRAGGKDLTVDADIDTAASRQSRVRSVVAASVSQNVEFGDDGQALVVVDVVGRPRIAVIGAGAAGLAAGRKLSTDGYLVTIFEARDRLGGRAYTDASLDLPFDAGCHWLHKGPTAKHPWLEAYRWLKRLGKVEGDLIQAPDAPRYVMYVGNTAFPVTGALLSAIYGQLEMAMEPPEDGEGDGAGDDAGAAPAAPAAPVSVGTLLANFVAVPAGFAYAAENPGVLVGRPTLAGLTLMAKGMLGSLDEGTEIDNFSATDKQRMEYADGAGRDVGANQVPPFGFGRLVAEYGEAIVDERLAIKRGQAATVIRHGASTAGPYVEIDTVPGRLVTAGVVDASAVTTTAKYDAVVVTVPPPIVVRDFLTFDPALPAAVSTAFANLPMGNFKKILLKFSRNVFGHANTHNVYPYVAAGTPLWRFITCEPTDNCITAIVGGAAATVLDGQSDATVLEAAMSRLAAMLGEGVRDHLLGSRVTKWGTDQWSLGAYSYCAPGNEAARGVLADTHPDDQIFFAGEATFAAAYATAHGAYLSGVAAAEAVEAAVPLPALDG